MLSQRTSAMNKNLLDILVCPFDKITSLELLAFQLTSESQLKAGRTEKSGTIANTPEAAESVFSATANKSDTAMLDKKESLDQNEIVEEGLLLCKSCQRFYPITEEIPIILPDELRDKKKDIEFLKKWKDSIPNELLISLKPWTL